MPKTTPRSQTPADVIEDLAGIPRPVAGEPLTGEQQAQEQLIAVVAQLIDDRHFRIFNQDEVPSAELIARILCARRMLTSPELLEAQIANHHSILSTLYASAVADVDRMRRYTAALQRVATLLLGQVDEVASLAAVAKTRKGRTLIEQAQAARGFYEKASDAFRERKPAP